MDTGSTRPIADVWKTNINLLIFFFNSYGDLYAITQEEKWFSTGAMLVGIGLFFGLILGGMASMLTNLDSQRARYIHHLNVIKDHMVCNASSLLDIDSDMDVLLTYTKPVRYLLIRVHLTIPS